jgi:asparagine synthase (glutamine-hydrolysing)
MCGLTGFWDRSARKKKAELCCTVEHMACTLALRGPDDSGEWAEERSGIALGFRRLAIVDLSPAGHQPMVSASERYAIAFNGEVYNFKALREELTQQGAAPVFRGHSDTEVMLAAIEAWGLEAAVKKFVGMFAFALWDRLEQTLHLVRDRVGIKPLYYGWAGDTFLFGSELKALKAHPAFRPEIDRDALTLLLRHNYIPSPYSIYKGIHKLPPGTILTLSGSREAEPVAYWSLREAAGAGIADPWIGTDDEAIKQLDTLLREAVGLRMVADVPLGAFLSGGIDSSAVVALMQAQSSRPVKTFSIGFHENGYDEAPHAAKVAKHLGTDHTELYLSPEDAQAVIPSLPSLYDEPFSDSSQIPTLLVSQLARRHVTVSLSGDGGDELFGGYNRYFAGQGLWDKFGWMPAGVRRTLAGALTALPPAMVDSVTGRMGAVLPKRLAHGGVSSKLAKVADILCVNSPEEMYKNLVSHWEDPASVVLGADKGEPETPLTRKTDWTWLPSFTQRMMYLDTLTYLPDDILCKVDRASMGVSLEARVPLLDHRVLEFAWRLPLSLKVRDGQGKWLLRQVLYDYVPREMIERPKMGFGIPIDAWLRGPLRSWAEALLDEQRLRNEGFFQAAPIRAKWAEHLSGQRNWQYHLWDILMFQAWLENNRDAF